MLFYLLVCVSHGTLLLLIIFSHGDKGHVKSDNNGL